MSKNKQFIQSVLLVSLTFMISGYITQHTALAQEDDFIVEEDVTYSRVGDVELKLDLARPATGRGPFPALVFIHGGWWQEYTRKVLILDIRLAAKRGYVGVTIDHRLTIVKENGKSKYPYPAQIYDVKCAIRWLRANARKYKIDPNHIGVIGFSSGGHLALMLGLTEPSDGLEGKCGKMKYSSQVQAVVNLAGITELESCYYYGAQFYQPFFQDFLEGTPDEVPQKYKVSSPLTYVSINDAPVLTIHGDKDVDVPPNQAELLDERMKEVGAIHTLIIKKGTEHRRELLFNLMEDYPVWDFFDKHLKGN